MHENGCFTGCLSTLFVFLFFFALWATIESNFQERLLYLSDKSEEYTVVNIKKTLDSVQWFDDRKYHSYLIDVWKFTLNDSTVVSEKEEKYSIGDSLKRFYYINHRNEKIYSNYYPTYIETHSYNIFWESAIFVLYILFFLLVTVVMYSLYFEHVKDDYNERLKGIEKVHLTDKIYAFLDLNKLIISVSMLSSALLIFSLYCYFIKVPKVPINPANFILFLLIFTFLIPIVFIQIFRKKDRPQYRKPLNIIGIILIISTFFTLFLTLIEIRELGTFEQTSLSSIFSWLWDVVKNM